MGILVKHAAELVTVSGFEKKSGRDMQDLGIITDGAVVMEGDKIVDVGTTAAILSRHNERDHEVINATGKAVLPGFIDPHTHFVFGGYRAEEFGMRLEGKSYMDIMAAGGGIASTTEATREESFDMLYHKGVTRLDQCLRYGVTTVEGKSGYGLDHDTELKQLRVMKKLSSDHPVDVVPTFMGAHAVPKEYKGKADAYLDMLIEDVLPTVRSEMLARFVDIFCEEGVFSVEQSRRYLTAAKAMGFKLKMHADEVISLGGAELAAELGALSADHLLAASELGIARMTKEGVIGVLLPTTAFCLDKPYANARRMIDHGMAVALATDFNPGSSFTQSIPLVMALAALKMGMTPEEIVTASTLNAAAAVDRADMVGSIDVGKKADLVILRYPSYRYLVYNTGQYTVEHVIKNNQLLF